MIVTPGQTGEALRKLLPGLFVAGLGVVALHNWRLWQRDRDSLERAGAEKSPAPPLARTPKVSALVAAWNEAGLIEEHIRGFLALHYPDKELVLCAGGSDGTYDLAKRFVGPQVVVLEQLPGEGKQKALARAMERATGEVIYLTDADCMYDDKALLRLLEPLVEQGEGAATGGSRPLDRQLDMTLPYYLWAADTVSAARATSYTTGLLGRNAILTRTAIQQSGGLDFEAPTGTDYHLAKRLAAAGIPIKHVPQSVVASAYAETLDIHRRKQARWLRSLLLYGIKYRAWQDVAATARTVAIGLLMLVMPFGQLVFGRLALAVWGLLFAQALAARLRHLAYTARASQRPVPPRLLAALVPLILADFGIWALPAFELLGRKRRTRW